MRNPKPRRQRWELIRQPTEVEIAWLAGFFDGEGCIGIYPKSKGYSYIVTISNTDPRPLAKFREIFGGNIHLNNNRHLAGHENDRPCYHYALYARGAQLFLELALPYFVIKKEQAEIFLEARRNKSPWVGRNFDLSRLANLAHLTEQLKTLKKADYELQ